MNPVLSTAEELRAAAAFLVREGWMASAVGDHEPGGCILQALAVVRGVPKSNWEIPVPPQLVNAVLARAPFLQGFYRQTSIIFKFNDRFCHSQETALAVLEEAAVLAENDATAEVKASKALAKSLAEAFEGLTNAIEDSSKAALALGSTAVLTEEQSHAISQDQTRGSPVTQQLRDQLRTGRLDVLADPARSSGAAADCRGSRLRHSVQADSLADQCA